MTRPVRTWAGSRARGRTGSLVSRLPRVTVSVVLLCALVPAVASAHSERRSHAHRHAVHKVQKSLHTSANAARSRRADLQLGSGERSRHGSLAVRRLQRGLRRAGYAPGPVDGRYGPLTMAAVEQFQSNHALVVNGIVGPATRRAMRAAPVLSLGAGEGSAHGSPAVAHLQRQLKRAGFTPGPVDGRFGPRTEHALIDFQRARHLAVDGIAGPITGRALQAVGRVSRQHRPAGKAAPSRSAPVTHGSQPNRHPSHTSGPNHNPKPRPRPARVPAPGTPRLPTIWILIALGVLGLLAVVAGYFQRPIRTRAGRLTRGARAIRRGGTSSEPAGTPEALPEPAPVKFVLYEDNSGGYYWTIVSEDGQVLAHSAAFETYEEANVAADTVYRGVAGASFEDRSNASQPADLPGSREVTTPDRTDAERSLEQGASVSREDVTRRAKAEGWAWPAGSSSTPGGRRR